MPHRGLGPITVDLGSLSLEERRKVGVILGTGAGFEEFLSGSREGRCFELGLGLCYI